MARTQRRHQKICAGLYKMLIEQSPTSTKTRRTSLTEDTTKTMAGDQYQHNWTITQVQWNGCYCGYSGLIYEDNMIKDDNNKYLFKRDSQDLQR